MDRKDTIEQKAGSAVLQAPVIVAVGDREYKVAPPSTATLILASEAVSLLPRFVPDKEKITEQSYRYARDCRPIGDVLAIIILGAKNLVGYQKSIVKTRKPVLWGLFHHYEEKEVTTEVDRKKELSDYLLENLSPKQLNDLFAKLTNSMELGSFFALTTFLTEINLLSPTKVEKEN